ncbi:MAG: adenosylcobinamide-phosphate synthase CbiB [Lachnospiraceae bacterium]
MILRGMAIGIGFLLDLCLGDPHAWWHPVQGIGSLICILEQQLRRRFPKDSSGELTAGIVLVLLVLLITGGSTWGILQIAGWIHPGLKFAVTVVMCYQILAAKSLKTESMKVYEAGKNGDIEKARLAVSMIVGRDTAVLSEEGIIKAAIETVAENTSDGVIAPLCFLFLGGPVGGFLYKAVNTMDSMIGYKNDSYLYFGRAAARLDDLVNWIPARLSALLLIGAAWLRQFADPAMSGARAYRIWRRDRRCHQSPNSAQGEAACAGALGIALAGDAWYFGIRHTKPVIGDAERDLEYEDIRRVNTLMYISAWLTVIIGTGGMVCWRISTEVIFTGILSGMIFRLI